MRKFKSEYWNIKYRETDDPLWIIVAILDNKDEDETLSVWLGVAQSETKEGAIGTLIPADIEDNIYIDAFELFSVLSQADMLQHVSEIIDTAIDKE